MSIKFDFCVIQDLDSQESSPVGESEEKEDFK